MDRRQFLHGSLAASLAGFFADARSVRNRTTPSATQPARRPSRAAPAATRKLDARRHSRTLHWLRTADEVAKASDRDGVRRRLPDRSGASRPHRSGAGRAGAARVRQPHPQPWAARRPDQGTGNSATSPTPTPKPSSARPRRPASPTTRSAATRYDLTKPLRPQLDAIKPRLERLVRLNEAQDQARVRHRAPASTRSAAPCSICCRSCSGSIRDSSASIGTRATWRCTATACGRRSCASRVRTSRRSAGAIADGCRTSGSSVKAARTPGPYPRVEPLVTQPDGSAIPGTPGRRPRGVAAAARGRRAVAAAARGGGEVAVAARRRRRPPAAGCGRGTARGPANSAGAGSIDNTNPLYRRSNGEQCRSGRSAARTPRAAAGARRQRGHGHGCRPHPARAPRCSRRSASTARRHCESEYAGIGGAETGADKITLPRQWVIGMLKRDVITIRKSFEMANSGVAI